MLLGNKYTHRLQVHNQTPLLILAQQVIHLHRIKPNLQHRTRTRIAHIWLRPTPIGQNDVLVDNIALTCKTPIRVLTVDLEGVEALDPVCQGLHILFCRTIIELDLCVQRQPSHRDTDNRCSSSQRRVRELVGVKLRLELVRVDVHADAQAHVTERPNRAGEEELVTVPLRRWRRPVALFGPGLVGVVQEAFAVVDQDFSRWRDGDGRVIVNGMAVRDVLLRFLWIADGDMAIQPLGGGYGPFGGYTSSRGLKEWLYMLQALEVVA